MDEIRLTGIDTEMYNPFGAVAEELLAAALDESGMLLPSTTINDIAAGDMLSSPAPVSAAVVSRGIRSMKQIGHCPDSCSLICGCIEQVHQSTELVSECPSRWVST